ncbi:hypothetical protein JCM6882_007232 [Rhodosporidiobolus microsporus]
MPFLSLPSSTRLFYEIVSNEGQFDPHKPTLVALVPFCIAQASSIPQIGPSSPLRQTHNIFAFSPRSHGRTVSEVKPQHDAFVSAADLAFAFEALQLPPSHVFAPGAICGRIGLAFTTLFPDLVLTLALAGVSGSDPMTSIEGFRTLEATMFNPSDVEDLYEIMAELALQLWDDCTSADKLDDFINLLLRRHNPRHASKSYELCRLSYMGMHLPAEAVAEIKTPVLLFHGERDGYSNPAHSQRWQSLLTGSSEVELHLIPDAPHLVWSTQSDFVLSHLTSFLSRHALPPSPTSSAPSPASPDFALALRTCARMTSNPKVLLRNPRSPESFSALTKEEKDDAAKDLERVKGFEKHWRAQPLPEGAEGSEPWDEGMEGRVPRPKWRWSRRHDERPTSDRGASARFSVASEVVVQIASVQETTKLSASSPGVSPGSVSPSRVSMVESNILPPAQEADEEQEKEDEDGSRSRKDSGFIESFLEDDELDAAKQLDGVLESMSRVALAKAQGTPILA